VERCRGGSRERGRLEGILAGIPAVFPAGISGECDGACGFRGGDEVVAVRELRGKFSFFAVAMSHTFVQYKCSMVRERIDRYPTDFVHAGSKYMYITFSHSS
jgi:hypothetical protein